MKRSISELSSIKTPGASTPGMIRSCSHDSVATPRASSGEDFPLAILKHQNKELAFEIQNKKRTIRDLRLELQHQKKQSAAAEEMLSVVDRSFNQFNEDVSQVLSALLNANKRGHDFNAMNNDNLGENKSLSLFKSYLESGDSFFSLVPVNDVGMTMDSEDDENGESPNFVNMLQLQADDWANEREIEDLRKEALENVDLVEKHASDDGQSGNQECKRSYISDSTKSIHSELNRRNQEVKTKLAQLLDTKITSSDYTFSMPESTAQARHFRSENLLLTELIAKYKTDIINLQAQSKLYERRLYVQERKAQFSVVKMGNDNEKRKEDASENQSGEADKVDKGSSIGEKSPLKDSSENTESVSGCQAISLELAGVKKQLAEKEAIASTLEQQVADSEEKRSLAEQAFTSYVFSSVASDKERSDPACVDIIHRLPDGLKSHFEKRCSKEAQDLIDIRKQLNDTRTYYQDKLSAVEADKKQQVCRIGELETAMSVLNASLNSRLKDISDKALVQIAKFKKERDQAIASLHTLEQEAKVFDMTKKRIEELEKIESSTRRQCSHLSDRVKALSQTVEIAEKNLSASRSRETELTNMVSSAAKEKEQYIVEMIKKHAVLQAEEAEEGMIPETSSVDVSQHKMAKEAHQDCHKALTSLLKASQNREKEVSAELANAKESMNDLIEEIEGVASEEEKSREQNIRLHEELTSSQAGYKELRLDNLRLHQDIQNLHESKDELNEKVENFQVFMKQQNDQIETLRSHERELQGEIQKLNNDLLSSNSAAEIKFQELQTLESKLAEAESALADVRRKMHDLKSRNSELNKNFDKERKKSLNLERRLSAAQAISSKEELSGETLNAMNPHHSGEDGNQMLDLTLKMLRCSVCHDRFKEVAITRCFHLFCKPCIDLNLSTRHRKCPACGERFGQDDVRTVYFTH